MLFAFYKKALTTFITADFALENAPFVTIQKSDLIYLIFSLIYSESSLIRTEFALIFSKSLLILKQNKDNPEKIKCKNPFDMAGLIWQLNNFAIHNTIISTFYEIFALNILRCNLI